MTPSLFFLDGAPLGNGSIALAAQYNDMADEDCSRLLLFIDGIWKKVDFDEDVIRSVAFCGVHKKLFLLGKSGIVYTIGGAADKFTFDTIKGTKRHQQVVDPDEYGELFRVRAIRGRVFVCGLGGQTYEYIDDTWVAIGFQDYGTHLPDFEDIALDKNQIPIAVGWHGAVYSFGSTGPTLIDVPTNQHLHCIAVASDDSLVICGNNGQVLWMSGSVVEDHSVNLQPVRNLWATAIFNGNIYVCEPGRLLVKRDNEEWAVEDVSNLPKPTFYRLAVFDSELWSIGADHVFLNKNDTWEQLLVPGNEIAA